MLKVQYIRFSLPVLPYWPTDWSSVPLKKKPDHLPHRDGWNLHWLILRLTGSQQRAETLKTPGLQWQGSNSIDSKSKLTGLLSMTNCSVKRSCHGAERACVLPGCVSLSKSESGCTGLRHLAAVVAQIRFKKKKKAPVPISFLLLFYYDRGLHWTQSLKGDRKKYLADLL